MRLLYPSNPLQPRQADETYAEEHAAAVGAGFPVSLFSFEDFGSGTFRPRPALEVGEIVCYRGWMLPPTEYGRLVSLIQQAGAVPLTSREQYELCHHLPGWYPHLREFTPETVVFAESDDIASALARRGWTGCFLKDYVKSLSTAGGSLVTDLARISEVIAKMKKFRGQIEGGLCARQIEDLDPNTEMRHFVFRGKAYSASADTPEVVRIAAQRIQSPFFSVDTIQKADGTVRIVELGDGQVSDRKSWTPDQIIKMLGERAALL